MFDLVNNVNEVEFVDVAERTLSKIQWRDELLKFGLTNQGKFFLIEGAIAPIFLGFADENYIERFGHCPRVTVSRVAADDKFFLGVCSQLGIENIKNCGSTIKGYDFKDGKTPQEMASFLVGFEQAYRKLKASYINRVNPVDSSKFNYVKLGSKASVDTKEELDDMFEFDID